MGVAYERPAARAGSRGQQQLLLQQRQRHQRVLRPAGRRRAGRGTGGESAAGVLQGRAAIAVPGPLFISEGFDRERLKDMKPAILPGSFIQFPVREEVETKRTPPLVRWVHAAPPYAR